MIINKNIKELKSIINIKNENVEVSYFYHDLLDENYNIVTSIKTNYFNELIGLFNLKKDEIKLLKSHEADNINCLDENKYLKNDYYKNIKLDNIKFKNISFYQNYYEPYEVFLYDNLVIKNGIEVSKVGYFKNRFNYITILQDNKIWMSITPHEINTMEKAINNAFGDVLVYGLGLGYFAYMVSNKENVTSVTIIENNQDIIELFNKYILNQFKNKHKIKVIYGDALDFKVEKYNYHFIDLWHDEVDGLDLYIKLKRLYPNATYWIEEELKTMIKRIIITLVEENIMGYGDNDYKSYKNELDRITNRFYEITKDIKISNIKDLNLLLSDKSLIKLYKKY